MITSSGVKCDVWGKYILPVQPDEMINNFTIAGIKQTMHCDNACRKLVEQMMAEKIYTVLPKGPLREVYEKHSVEK